MTSNRSRWNMKPGATQQCAAPVLYRQSRYNSDGVVPRRPAMISTDSNPPTAPPASARVCWGFWPVALGLIALIPTALLVASFVLLTPAMPLSVATVLSAAVLGAFQIALVWLLAMRAWRPPLALLGLTPPETSPVRTVLLAVAAMVCSLGFAQLYTMTVMVLDWNALAPGGLPSNLLLPGGMAIFSVIALAVVTPVAEEIFFRGFVLRGLANHWGFPWGLVISSLVFAGLHFSPALLLPVFVTGLLLGVLYRSTGSLWPCIAVHAAQNLVATLTIIFGL